MGRPSDNRCVLSACVRMPRELPGRPSQFKAYILWRNARGVYDNIWYFIWELSFADNALASNETLKPKNPSPDFSRHLQQRKPIITDITMDTLTPTRSAGTVRRLQRESLLDQPTDSTRCLSDPDSMSTNVRRTSLRSRLLVVRSESLSDQPTDSTGRISDPDSMSRHVQHCIERDMAKFYVCAMTRV
jgi:hypothetical protein